MDVVGKKNIFFEKFSYKGEKRDKSAEVVGSEIKGDILFGLSF